MLTGTLRKSTEGHFRRSQVSNNLEELIVKAREFGTLAKDANQAGNVDERRKINWKWNAFMKRAHSDLSLENSNQSRTFGEGLALSTELEEALTTAFADAYLGRV